MSVKTALVLGSDGRPQQLQSGDTLAGVGGAAAPTYDQTFQQNTPAGAPVYSISSGTVDKAQANGSAATQAWGLAKQAGSIGSPGPVQYAGVLQLATSDWDVITGGSGGLTATSPYYLDPNNPGQMTTTPPTTTGQYVVELGKALSTEEFLIAPKAPILL